MQEIHPIGGGRFFGAGGGGGDRRLRPHHHHNTNNQNHQALKCPRCDSLNTKFCYYNNYNLSQPRHFCKTCRRYWTKGGVLRNVPVGGGCRKSKRSKPKHSSLETPAAAVAATLAPPPPPTPSSSQPENERKTSNSLSSSESSSLTAATAAAATATEPVSAPSSNSASNNLLDNLQDSTFFIHPNSNPSFEPGVMEQGGESGIFSEIENLTSLITSTNEALAFGYGNIPDASSFQFSTQWQKGMNMSDHHHQDLKFPETTTTTGSLLDQTVPVDLSAVQNKIGHGGFGLLDWQGSTDQGLCDLPNTVDQAYWSHTQWNQDNPSLFHLP